MRRRRRTTILILLLAGLVGPALRAADPAEAERRYRVARRLAAEGSPEARPALLAVIEQDPGGGVADDARVDLALLEGLPRWPEELGRIDDRASGRALEQLDTVIDELSGGDRAPEARYYRALLRLEPSTGYDPSAARLDLLTVAARESADAWSRAARYGVAWLAEQQGQPEQAAAAFARLLVDAPGTPEAARAAVGLARVGLRDGRFDEAARWLQHAVEGSAPAGLEAIELRELAMRRFLAGLGLRAGLGDPQVVTPSTGVRSAVGIAAGAGGLLIGDGREGVAVLLDVNGRPADRWTVAGLLGVAADGRGALYAVGETAVFRLSPGGERRAVADLSTWPSPSGVAVEPSGRIWLLDRKGDALGRVEPSGGRPVAVWEGKGRRLAAIAWDGRRLVASETRQRTLVTIDRDGRLTPLVLQGVQRPGVVACDASGRIAVHDARADLVALYDPDGRRAGEVLLKEAGIGDPAALAFHADGALSLFDEDGGRWVRLP